MNLKDSFRYQNFLEAEIIAVNSKRYKQEMRYLLKLSEGAPPDASKKKR
jgi:hypothetical protein